MSKMFLTILLLSLYSCSSQKQVVTDPKQSPVYSNDKICSQRALDKIAQHDKEADKTQVIPEKTILAIREEIAKAIPDAKECYRNELDGAFSNIEESSVCLVIGTSKVGNLNFIDVDNRQKPLSAKLKNCLVDTFSRIDLRKAKDALIIQPINLIPKKK